MWPRSFYKKIFLSLFIAVPLVVYSATIDELNSSMNNLSSQIKSLDKEIAEYNKQINQTQGEAKTLKQALASLETRKKALLKQIDKIKLQTIETETNIKQTEGKISITENKIETNSKALAELLKSIYKKESDLPPFLGILTNKLNFGDTLKVIKEEGDMSHSVNTCVSNLKDDKKDLSNTKTVFEEHKQTLVPLNNDLSDQKKLIDQTSDEKNRLLLETKNKESDYQKLLAERKAKREALDSELFDIESKLSMIVDTKKIPAPGKGVLSYPLSIVRITQYFGNTDFSKGKYNGAEHNGVDFAASVGTPVHSARSGVVVGTGNTDLACSRVSYGKWVLIKHANGLTTLYGHLSLIKVTAGQTVREGEEIALSGNTGYATGPHLHFTVFASDAVHITSPTEYKSRVCGTYLVMPVSPHNGYLDPISYL